MIQAKADALGVSLSGIELVDPTKSAAHDEYTKVYYEMRHRKGVHLNKLRRICITRSFWNDDAVPVMWMDW